MSWKLWTKKEVTNSDDISKVMVELSNGSTVSIGEMVNSVEKDLKEKEDKKNACHNEDILEKTVKVNGEDMKVCDLVAAFEKKDKKNEADEDKDEDKKKDEEKSDKKNAEDEEKKKDEEKKDKKNESDEDKKSEDDEDKKKDEEKKDKKNSKDLLDAEEKSNAKEFVGVVADTMARKLARGVERYGSAK